MQRGLFVFAFLACLAMASATTYFTEEFGDSSWEKRWVKSKAKSDLGDFKLTAGKWYGDKDADKGVQTSQDARFYGYTAKMDKVFNNEGKDLVLQFQVRHEQKIDCGGGYIKLLPSSTDQEKFNGDSQYYIMFGPDICGTSTSRIHAIFNYNGDNHLHKPNTKCETDQLSHVYTFIVHPDRTYEIRVDGEKRQSGEITNDWDMLKPKKIKDPNASKPSDWVDEAEIADPEDTKPSDWDDEPAKIADPEASKPDDWDDEDDGEWEAPMIDNPKYKGEWKPKMIKNPDYKGPWVHPEIDNPEYKDDPNLHVYKDMEYVGFDLWQVKAGTIFDNIIVTDSVKEAEDFMAATYGKNIDGEKAMFEEADKAKKEEEEKARKAAEAASKKDDGDDEEDEEEDAADDDDDDEEDDKAKKRREKLEKMKKKAKAAKSADKDEL